MGTMAGPWANPLFLRNAIIDSYESMQEFSPKRAVSISSVVRLMHLSCLEALLQSAHGPTFARPSALLISDQLGDLSNSNRLTLQRVLVFQLDDRLRSLFPGHTWSLNVKRPI